MANGTRPPRPRPARAGSVAKKKTRLPDEGEVDQQRDRRGGTAPSRIPRSRGAATRRRSRRYGSTAGSIAGGEHLPQEQGGEAGPLRADPREGLEHAVQRRRARPRSRLDRFTPPPSAAKADSRMARVQPPLAAEVIADQRLVDAGARRDLLDRHAVEPRRANKSSPAGEERPAGGARVSPLPLPGRVAVTRSQAPHLIR